MGEANLFRIRDNPCAYLGDTVSAFPPRVVYLAAHLKNMAKNRIFETSLSIFLSLQTAILQ
jgi:hypothetical protein